MKHSMISMITPKHSAHYSLLAYCHFIRLFSLEDSFQIVITRHFNPIMTYVIMMFALIFFAPIIWYTFMWVNDRYIYWLYYMRKTWFTYFFLKGICPHKSWCTDMEHWSSFAFCTIPKPLFVWSSLIFNYFKFWIALFTVRSLTFMFRLIVC